MGREERRMFTIEQYFNVSNDKHIVRLLFNGEELAIYGLNRKATDEELKQMLDIFTKEIGKAIDEAILYGTSEERKINL